MSNRIKFVLYPVLISLALYFGYKFYRTFSAISEANMVKAGLNTEQLQKVEEAKKKRKTGKTNDLAKPNLAATNAVTASETNSVASTNAVVELPLPGAGDLVTPEPVKPASSTMIGYLGAFVASMILLGLLVGHDVSNFIGNRAVDFVFNENLIGVKDPEYEEAEHVWAQGQHLDAIHLMRNYLRKHPREQYVAIRIAEIYEKDLRNYLAAALEYEEILKHKIEPERWGWAAIHLCNIYSKMGKMDKTLALLRRIDADYPETAAAEKARKRLAMYEAAGSPELPKGEEDGAEGENFGG